MIDGLSQRMTGEGCRAELFGERHRDALRAACAEDEEIWEIYANNFGPAGFEDSIDRYVANPNNRTFVLLDGDELAGMSSFLGIDESRQVLEIGGTYYRPKFRGSGFNRRVKDMMLRRAFDCGISRVRQARAFRSWHQPRPCHASSCAIRKCQGVVCAANIGRMARVSAQS